MESLAGLVQVLAVCWLDKDSSWKVGDAHGMELL